MIGILTLHNAINYGAILQTYALQHKLDLLGIENEIIEYECPNVAMRHRIKFKWWNPLGYFIKTRTKNIFHNFLVNKVRMSSSQAFPDKVTSYDAYLVGSDQIWNMDITGNDLTYFLKSVPKEAIKYSYAASIGSYKFSDSKLQEECITLLNEFSGISVREKACKTYLSSCINHEALKDEILVHPDPVLLITRNEWQKFGRCKQKGNYILLYMIWRQPELIQKAQELSKRLSIPVIWISDSLRHYYRIKNKRCCCPEEFVGLFENSTYVITNSFHGTAFSILFHKPFFTVTLKGEKRIDRIADLLESTGLENCSINSLSVDINTNICWNVVDEKLHEMVLNAEIYLKKQQSLPHDKRKGE